jgi:hypothetical protein
MSKKCGKGACKDEFKKCCPSKKSDATPPAPAKDPATPANDEKACPSKKCSGGGCKPK